MTEGTSEISVKTLRLRKRLKHGKPNFVRPESWRYVRLKESWRRPRGLDHKVRLKYDGWPPGVSVGYRGPKSTRGIHPSGFREVLVYNTEDLKKVDNKTQVARIAHTVGRRKRAGILTEARKKKIRVLNVKVTKEVVAEEKELGKEAANEKDERKEIEEAEKPVQGRETRKKLKEEKKQE